MFKRLLCLTAATAVAGSICCAAVAAVAKKAGEAVKLDAQRRWYVYSNGEVHNGAPSNWMPAEASQMILVDAKYRDEDANVTVLQIRLSRYVSPNWWGIAWSSADGYWGEQPGPAWNLKGAKKLVCILKGTGRVQLKACITGDKPHGDACGLPPQTEYFNLDPRKYQVQEITFSPEDNLNRVITPFVIVSSRDQQSEPGKPVTVQIREIYWQF